MEFDNLSDLEKIFQDLSEEKTDLDELRKYFYELHQDIMSIDIYTCLDYLYIFLSPVPYKKDFYNILSDIHVLLLAQKSISKEEIITLKKISIYFRSLVFYAYKLQELVIAMNDFIQEYPDITVERGLEFPEGVIDITPDIPDVCKKLTDIMEYISSKSRLLKSKLIHLKEKNEGGQK